MQNEPHIGYDTQQVFLVFFIMRHGIFVIGRQKNLGAGSLPGLLLLVVERFFQKLGTLLQDNFIDGGQVCGIIPYRIFHQKNALHSRMQDVFLGIHGVFQQFDYGKDEVRITVPAEYVIYGRAVFMFYAIFKFPGIVG